LRLAVWNILPRDCPLNEKIQEKELDVASQIQLGA
jgi:hypothetical protein